MQEKIYNLYLAIAKMAGDNIRRSVCQENGINDLNCISVSFKGKDAVVELVKNVMTYTKSNAIEKYKKFASDSLTVKSTKRLAHMIDMGYIFIESILRSKDARRCQKQLIDYMMAERYFQEAYEYDVNHPVSNSQTAVDKAKVVIGNVYSLNFLGNFFFDELCPKFDEHLREQLAERAFNPLYSFAKEENIRELARKKYLAEFSSRCDYFLSDINTVKTQMRAERVNENIEASTNSQVERRSEKVMSKSPKPASSVDLYRSMFVQMPTQRRKRKFLNLKKRNNDIIICRPKDLAYKKQYADIELRTKRDFIHNCYADSYDIRKNMSENRFYFIHEANMYRKLWQIDSPIAYRQGYLYFPDGAVAVVDKGQQPYEVLHRINAIYAALFGFDPSDLSNPADWLYNSIRAAYTDEGNALYRLAMIEARQKNRI